MRRHFTSRRMETPRAFSSDSSPSSWPRFKTEVWIFKDYISLGKTLKSYATAVSACYERGKLILATGQVKTWLSIYLFIFVEVTTSWKTLHLYLCISVTWRLLLRRNILNKKRRILLYPWIYIMFWTAKSKNKGTNKQISICVPCSL